MLALFQTLWAFRLPVFLAVAFASGVFVTHKYDTDRQEATLASALAAQARQLNLDILKAQEKSAALTVAIQASDANVEKIKSELKPKIIFVNRPVVANSTTTTQGELVGPIEQKPEPGLGTPYLDQHTVRMLNSARGEDPATNAASSRDGEESAPSVTTVEGLVQSDLDITKMYRELAQRHDALVDYVTEMQKRASGQ